MKHLVTRGSYLAWDDGTPFFYLGDTAWELAHRLNREEADTYFRVRQEQGFNAAQIVALAEFDGLLEPNAYGRLPLTKTNGMPDPEKPDLDGPYSYWDHLDYIFDAAARQNMFVTLLPTWGDKFNRIWGKGPEIFTVENARWYGNWLARRYAHRWNLIWMLGGDRPLEPAHRAIIDAMAEGIRSADPIHLITFHPPGCHTSVEYVGDAPYVDIHSAQTGHGVEQCYESDRVMLNMRLTGKPYFDSEPRYEDHPACFDDTIGYYWNADDVRLNAYRDLLTGVCGHTYGNHGVWYMNREKTSFYPCTWEEALTHPGATQLHHVAQLRLNRDYFSLRPANEVVCTNYDGMGRVTAARGSDYLYAYSPLGLPFTLDCSFSGGKAAKASWFNPRTGEETVFAIVPPAGRMTYAPPSSGKGCDWLLILDRIP